ncbi:MAG: hypothetical protein JWM56_122 [Candidatus Peribacteria bacterium]|nr:hypothetical protein [Candidatus Peribacteria bacterium]
MITSLFCVMMAACQGQVSESVSALSRPWTVVSRGISEGRANGRFWQVSYVLRNDSQLPIIIGPKNTVANIHAMVSNSRVPAHAAPRASVITVTGSGGLSATADVIPSADDEKRCRERAVLQVWPHDPNHEDPPDPIAKAVVRLVATSEQSTWIIGPGACVQVRLHLEHDHFLYGLYDALLGSRTLLLTLGATQFADRLVLDQPANLPVSMPSFMSPESIPDDRRDSRIFLSAPDSLHVEAQIPGNQSYRFKEVPVPYGARMKLQFWYLVALGSEDAGKVRIVQYKDAPSSWKILSDGDLEQQLTTVGRWVKVERFFFIEPTATSLTMEFRIVGEIGEMWIDDISMEPVGQTKNHP